MSDVVAADELRLLIERIERLEEEKKGIADEELNDRVDLLLADIRQQVEAGATHLSFGDPDFLNGPAHALRVARAPADGMPGGVVIALHSKTGARDWVTPPSGRNGMRWKARRPRCASWPKLEATPRLNGTACE